MSLSSPNRTQVQSNAMSRRSTCPNLAFTTLGLGNLSSISVLLRAVLNKCFSLNKLQRGAKYRVGSILLHSMKTTPMLCKTLLSRTRIVVKVFRYLNHCTRLNQGIYSDTTYLEEPHLSKSQPVLLDRPSLRLSNSNFARSYRVCGYKYYSDTHPK